ncbi:MAG: tRNA pseudouridine(55) synthase TruB [Ruminococcaceae bacterium]|nr:tRNA pseudouridine(55) synthase TruB [Oscillospiraceae bacterium]
MLGLLLLDKPKDITSFGAVAKTKKLTGEKRVGHTGTLDPMATGVLPILIGRATVLSQYLIEADKSYNATIKLGIATDSCDITGNVISQSDVNCKDNDIECVLRQFLGRQMQTPPMFSAIKQNGVRMYELARRGEVVDIPAREIEVFSLDKKSCLNEQNEFVIECTVSKGTYIRSLCRDIGEILGCGATLTSLRRTKTAGFDISQCVSLDDLTPQNVSDYILPCDKVVDYLPQIFVSEKQSTRFTNGGQLSLDRIKYLDFTHNGIYRVYFGEKFLGLGRADKKDNILKIECLVDRRV